MKKQRYIVEIEMPDGDFISAGWLKDLIQTDCDVEDESRKKVTFQETSLPTNLDEAVREYINDTQFVNDKHEIAIKEFAFKAGAEWMAGQGVTISGFITGCDDHLGLETEDYLPIDSPFDDMEDVIVQIRKK